MSPLALCCAAFLRCVLRQNSILVEIVKTHHHLRYCHVKAASDQGAALLLLILLVAVASVMILNTQISTAVALRHARARNQSSSLNVAAADAAWYAVQKIAANASSSTGSISYSEERLLPSAVLTRVDTGSANALGAAALALAGGSVSLKDLTMVTAEASVSGATERVVCVITRKKSSKLKVLGWYEEE